jgi:HTH-type transcriptional regulator/antitoxin HigA
MNANIDFVPVEAFPPGEFLREEIAERGWTQEVFADILGKSERLVNEVIVGKREITAATAQALAAALGTSAQFWLNLESAYRLYREAQKNAADESVSRRAKLYSKAPVKEMLKRGWIDSSSNVDILERSVCDYFEISTIDEEPQFLPHAAKKSSSYDSVSASLMTWLYRARQLARASIVSGQFRHDSVAGVLEALRTLLMAPAEIRQVAKILGDHGIRLVIVEPISKTRVDGVTFWLNSKSPVIALSLRYDRVDSFWFVLMHELGHVDARDGQTDMLPIVDDLDLMKLGAIPENEKQAHLFAEAALVPPEELSDFIARTRPLYSKVKIANFARRVRVHPGIVVGQLQKRGEIDWSHSRNFLVKVRHLVAGTTLTDGWGFAPPVKGGVRS